MNETTCIYLWVHIDIQMCTYHTYSTYLYTHILYEVIVISPLMKVRQQA